MTSSVAFFEAFREGMADFGSLFAAVINSILVAFTYLFGVGAAAIFAKAVGKRFLDTSILPDAKTYWADLKLKNTGIDDYRRQF